MKKKPLNIPGDFSEGERLFLNSVADKIYAAEERNKTGFTFFLGEGGAELAKKAVAAASFKNHLFYGGFEGAERVMLGLFSDYDEPSADKFPISALTFTFRERDKLTHRDLLGAVMSAGIERETVGDILVGEGAACVFMTDAAAETVIRTVTKVGGTGVKISQGYDGSVMPVRNFKDISGTVQSLRLDCIVALAVGCSRAKAERLVSSGAVSVKGRTAENGADKLKEGSSFSVRGYGRFIFEKTGRSTKKERTFIELKKFI